MYAPVMIYSFVACVRRLCDEVGVRTRPAWVAPGVAVVPLFSWYKTSFMGGGGREPLSPQEEHFDCACYWCAPTPPPPRARARLLRRR